MSVTPYIPVNISVSNPPRGPGRESDRTFIGQGLNATFSWGVQPGSATIDYVGNSAPVQAGAWCQLQIGAHYFYGICKADTVNDGSNEGVKRRLEFVDLRYFLTADYVFCAFNKPDVMLVNGFRRKRYKHMFPSDYPNNIWTWTDYPLNAVTMLSQILMYRSPGLLYGRAGGTIGSPWTWDFTGEGWFPFGVFNYPLYDFDAQSGKRLDAVISEFCERMGCVVMLKSTPQDPWRLVFTRKGYGPQPVIPDQSDNKRVGVALSGNPTNVVVVGDRNLYQVMDVPMKKDWAPGWEKFLVFDAFVDDVYHRAKDPTTKKTYDKTANDPEQYIGRQLALARALEMTVGEYADLRDASSEADGAEFRDSRKYACRWRMDMPAALYIRTLLFRAFQPDEEQFSFANAIFNTQFGRWVPGNQVPLASLDIVDKQLCRMFQTDPTSGRINYDKTQVADGNGYAIVKGYQVGRDLFEMIRSDQFTLDFFKNAKNVWQHSPFQIDDSGEGIRFIIMDEPVIVSDNLVVQVDGHCVVNTNATVRVPEVKAALVFAAERFRYWVGTYPNVSRDYVENVNGVNLELVVPPGNETFDEVLYADNKSATLKAVEIGNAALVRQYYYSQGGYRLPWRPGMPASEWGVQLSGLVDRITITTSPNEGTVQTVDLTNERQRDAFEPEREYDRKTSQNSLFPGQMELRYEADTARKLAAAFRQSPDVRKNLGDLIAGRIGSNEPLQVVWFGPGTKAGVMPPGTVIRKKPTTFATSGGKTVGQNTIPTAPDKVKGGDDTVFTGVTVRASEKTTGSFRVQSTGSALVRVKGPVSPGDMVGLNTETAADWEFMVKVSANGLGVVRQSVPADMIKLVVVNLGSGGGGGGQEDVRFIFQRMPAANEHKTNAPMEWCWAIRWDAASTGVMEKVALPWKLRSARKKVTAEGFEITYDHYDASTQTRIAHFPAQDDGSSSELQVIIPRYSLRDVIVCRKGVAGQIVRDDPAPGPMPLVENDASVVWYDTNQDGRAWARKYKQAPPI